MCPTPLLHRPCKTLKNLIWACVCRGAVKGSLMVHDEEAEVSIRLATLIANSLHGHPAIPLLDIHARQLSAGRAHTAQGKYHTRFFVVMTGPVVKASSFRHKQSSNLPVCLQAAMC